MPVENGLPRIFDELDDAADVGRVPCFTLVEHGGKRRHALVADVLKEPRPMWIVLERQLVASRLPVVVAHPLELLPQELSQPRRLGSLAPGRR